MRLARRPVFPRHVAIVSGRRSPCITIPPVVNAHAVKAAAAGQLPFEVIDVRELDIRACGLIVIAVLIEPRNGIRTRSTVRRRVVLRNGRGAALRQRLWRKRPRTQGRPCGDCDPEPEPASARDSECAAVNLRHGCLLFGHMGTWTDSLIPATQLASRCSQAVMTFYKRWAMKLLSP